MTQALKVIDNITRQVARNFKNNLVFSKNCDTQFDDTFAKTGAKQGSSLRVRLPNRFTVNKTPTYSATDIIDPSTTITMANFWHVDYLFSDQELLLSADDINDRYAKPAAQQLAAYIDAEGMKVAYQATANTYGTPGTTPNSRTHIIQPNAILTDYAAPGDGRTLIVDSTANASLVDNLAGLFNPVSDISAQFKKGQFGSGVLGFENVAYSQSVASHTAGLQGGTPLVDGASQTTADWALSQTLNTKGWSNSITGVLKTGDTFTIAGVYAVNPLTGATLKRLQSFVVNADANSSGSGLSALNISPAIIVSGPYKSVSAAPADGAAITVTSGTTGLVSTQNMAMHKDAFAFVMGELPLPTMNAVAARAKLDNFSFRTTWAWDIVSNAWKMRIDCAFGFAAIRREWAVRLQG